MEYSGNKLTKLSGVSARTLRYYDEIGLLRPLRTAASGYRIYGQAELDRLQQILFYRELEFSLNDIARALSDPGFDRETAMLSHLSRLKEKRRRLDALISNVAKTIAELKGETVMTDKEKFEGFKQALADENERKYGKEIRGKYGDETVNQSNARLKGMTEEQYNEGERLRLEFEEALSAAFAEGDPAGAKAQSACDLHRRWLSVFYPAYSKEYHKGLGEMYAADDRFRANYDKFGAGCTEFLRDAINIYCGDA